MTRLFGALILFAAILALGCSGDQAIRGVADSLIAQPDPTVELLEAELRWMEDNLYRIDDQLTDCLHQLESTRRANAALRLELAGRELAHSTTSSSTFPKQVKDADSGDSSPSAGFDEETEDVEDLLDFAPKVEFGGSPAPEGLPGQPEVLGIPRKDSTIQPRGEAPSIPTDENPFLDDSVNPKEVKPKAGESAEDDNDAANQVFRIQLNDRLTGGFDRDGRIGHDGILVVIQPADKDHYLLSEIQDLTVELREPRKSGIAGQVAKWHFSDPEIRGKLKETIFGEAIQLELPWPNGCPTSELLDLVVTSRSPSGRRSIAEREIRIIPTTTALITQADASERANWQPGRPLVGNTDRPRWTPLR